MILCIGTTPACQRVMVFGGVKSDAVNRAVKTLDGAAGKSINVARVLHALGAKPVALTALGGDRGGSILDTLTSLGIDHDCVMSAARTRQCVTVIDETSGTVTELVEESPALSEAEATRMLDLVRKRMPSSKAAVMSGTLAPGVPKDFYAACVRLAHDAGALSIVDAQGLALTETLATGPGLVKPNRTELAATMTHDLPDEASVIAAMLELRELGAKRVVVTAGREPTLACDGRTFWRVTSPVVKAVNPIGSGDAFTAGLAWRLVEGDDLGEACRWASACGAANALHLMAGEVSREDVNRLVAESEAQIVRH